ncbi:MAG: hypothetical protein WCG25_05740 [bacterium]
MSSNHVTNTIGNSNHLLEWIVINFTTSASQSLLSITSDNSVTSSINCLSVSSHFSIYFSAMFIICHMFSYFSSACISHHSSFTRKSLYFIFLTIASINTDGLFISKSFFNSKIKFIKF